MRASEVIDVDSDVGDEMLPRPVLAGTVALHARLAECLRQRMTCVLATVLSRRGSAPATPGQKLLVASDGACLGTVGGGALERAVLRACVDVLGRALTTEPRVVSLNLGAALGMCCGGGVDVLIECFAAARTVGLVGAGHIATALAPMLARVGFAVTVVDEREDWSDAARFPEAQVRCDSFECLGEMVPRDGALLVMTHDHQLDQRAVEWALREGYAFVGGIGSRAKALRTRARLEAKGFEARDLARVRMPLGLAIGARSPEEIAVSVAAELIAWRHAVSLPDAALAGGTTPCVPSR